MPELDRRDFLKMVGIGASGAAASACSEPVEKLVPYVVQPESVTPGIATSYASTCTECAAACGLHVTTREGRPIKLEGNPDHPINKGALCARGQGSLVRAYHPDRIQGPLARSGGGSFESISWDDGQAKLAGKLKSAGGRAVILGGPVGPSLSGVIDEFTAAAGASRMTYEPFSSDALRSATEAVFGVASTPIFDASKADLIVDLGADFIDTGLQPVENSRQLADARDAAKHEDGGTRVVSVSPRMNLTTSNADAWIPAKAGSEGDVALALAKAVYDKKGAPVGMEASKVRRVLGSGNAAAAAAAAGVDVEKINELAETLLHAKSALVLPPGVAATSSSAVAVSAVVLLLNAMLGALGRGLTVPTEADAVQSASYADLERLVSRMSGGQVQVLLIHDSNPLYSLPKSLGFAEALAKVPFVVSFSSMTDETSEVAHLVLPDHSPFESWGDAAPRAGVRSLVQPTLRPLFDTRALGDTLMALGRALGGAMPASTFKEIVQANWAGTSWRDALGRGGLFSSDAGASAAPAGDLAGVSYTAPRIAGSGEYTLVAFPHSYLGDGSAANNGWLQELPDPVTKLSWWSWAEMSFDTAERLGVGFGDVVELSTGAGSVEVSVFPRGGIRDDVIAVPIGQGHTVGYYSSMAGEGQEGVPRGINVNDLLVGTKDEAGGRTWLNTRVSARKTGAYRRLALSQWVDNQRGRGLAPVVTVAKLQGKEEEHHDAHHANFDEPPIGFDAAYDADPDQPYRWGMTIDNDRCNGCSACITACSIENNVTVVGETQSIMHREMHWLRIERYNGDGDREGGGERRPIPNRERLGEVDVRHLPLPCQHCGAAPCEAVCPVIGTYHSIEGINSMVYNRCVGTRYCANNCIYKVRRFNYYDYGNKNYPGLLGMMTNPDVTSRQQGVMEKCSLCVQRIETARQPAKDEGRVIADGEVTPACAQTCPTGAITFGNLRDDKSRVRTKAATQDKRAYHALQEYNARPAITYLAQVKRSESHEGSH